MAAATRVKLAHVNPTLVFGLPYLLSPNQMMPQVGLAGVAGRFKGLVAGLRSRMECILIRCSFDFDQGRASLVPLR